MGSSYFIFESLRSIFSVKENIRTMCMAFSPSAVIHTITSSEINLILTTDGIHH